MGGDIANTHRLCGTGGDPADAVRALRTARRGAPGRLHVVPPERVPDRKYRRASVLRSVVRTFLLDAVRVRAGLPGFDFFGRAAALHRSGDAGPGGAGGRRALRPARRPSAHRIGHADLRDRLSVAVRRYEWNAGKP